MCVADRENAPAYSQPYNGDYFDPTAYWVQDNVFYSLRVFGDEAEKAEIQAILERILEDV